MRPQLLMCLSPAKPIHFYQKKKSCEFENGIVTPTSIVAVSINTSSTVNLGLLFDTSKSLPRNVPALSSFSRSFVINLFFREKKTRSIQISCSLIEKCKLLQSIDIKSYFSNCIVAILNIFFQQLCRLCSVPYEINVIQWL